jgi:hypothetical protein
MMAKPEVEPPDSWPVEDASILWSFGRTHPCKLGQDRDLGLGHILLRNSRQKHCILSAEQGCCDL